MPPWFSVQAVIKFVSVVFFQILASASTSSEASELCQLCPWPPCSQWGVLFQSDEVRMHTSHTHMWSLQTGGRYRLVRKPISKLNHWHSCFTIETRVEINNLLQCLWSPFPWSWPLSGSYGRSLSDVHACALTWHVVLPLPLHISWRDCEGR